MNFWSWLTNISQSAAPPGEPFAPQWQYVAMALLLPALMGAVLAAILRALEKVLKIRLGGGSV
jgi:hypothetical protein